MENSKAVAGTTDLEFSIVYHQNMPSPCGLRPKCSPAALKRWQVGPATCGAFRLADHIIWAGNEILYKLKIRPNRLLRNAAINAMNNTDLYM
jgi:hypothetical protein